MTFQQLNYGTTPNDRTGDLLRDGIEKINNNFKDLYGYPTAGNANKVLATPNSDGEVSLISLTNAHIPILVSKTLTTPIIQYNRRSWSATSETATTNDTILAFTGSANTTLNLYASSSNAGRILIINNRTSLYTITIDPNGAETLDGNATLIIYPGHSVTIQCDGTNWVSLKEQGRGRVLIQAQTVSTPVASIEFTQGFSSLYKSYMLEFENLLPATNNVSGLIRFSNNGGITYRSGASDYCWGTNGNQSTTQHSRAANSGNCIYFTFQGIASDVTNGVNEGVNLVYTILSMSSSSLLTSVFGNACWGALAANQCTSQGSGRVKIAEVNNAIQISFSSGNIASGVARLYGVY